MLSVYFEFWTSYWQQVASALDNRPLRVHWVVEVGSLRKALDEVHADTGMHRLVAPTKERIEAALDGSFGDLTVIFRIDPSVGLMHAFQGPESLVRRAQAALKGSAPS